MPRIAPQFRQGSLATSATAASVVVLIALPLPLPAQLAEPQQPSPEAQGDRPPLVFSPWTTFCLRGQEPDAKLVCFTESGGIRTGEPPATGAPTDPKTFAEQQQRLQRELARRAEEARMRLERSVGEENR
jgi:hypothetical protein